MTFRTIIARSVRFHWRADLGVVLGAAVGSAALIGALVVGDSVRESLRERALQRLGRINVALESGDRFFRQELAHDMRAVLPGGGRCEPALVLSGSAASPDGTHRANRVQVVGVEDSFWRLAGGKLPAAEIPNDGVLLNRALAGQLNVKSGDAILIRVPKATAFSREAPITPQGEASISLHFKVQGVVADEQLGLFSLRAATVAPFNAYVRLDQLATISGATNRANLVLVAWPSDDVPGREAKSSRFSVENLQQQLGQAFQLADAELELRVLPAPGAIELRSRRVFLDPPAIAAGLAAANAKPVLTYLANLLRAGTNTAPYSMVAAAGLPYTPPDMRDDEMVVSQWLADDLHVVPGDEIALSYFLPESGAKLTEATNTFRIRSIAPMEMPWADRTLMPEFPGIEKAESTHDWDAGFPLVHKIRQKDEDYWKEFRGTPKAFISLAAGRNMWASRFGGLTAIRFPIPTGMAAAEYRAQIEKKILAKLKPEEVGLRFEPVREQALKAAAQAQDFGQLFLGFSLFLIAAALVLMALLFRLGLEQRASEIGTLLALGFRPAQVRRLLLGEGVALALAGGTAGVVGGGFYARAMLLGLETIWRDAVGAMTLSFHMTAQSLVIGLFAAVMVSAVTIRLTLRSFVRRAPRELLAGDEEMQSGIYNLQSSKLGRAALTALVAGLSAAGLVAWAAAKGETANAGVFFSAGALLLVAGFGLMGVWLGRLAGGGLAGRPGAPDGEPAGALAPAPLTLGTLGLRGCGRRRKRSMATMAMLACGGFLIVSIGVFRLDSKRDASRRSSGIGGFALIGETTMPVVKDLNSKSGREFFALMESDMANVKVVSFRVREGDEASCLNLNHAQRPRLLGVKPEMLEGRFTFAKGAGWASLQQNRPEEEHRASAARSPKSEVEIPAIGDASSIKWAMGSDMGGTIDYLDERGWAFKVRIVGMLANSILQGSLIINEAEFVQRFPGESGCRLFLIDAPTNSVSQVSTLLSRAFQDEGMELVPATQRLAQFNAVQNTYLGTFQVLGGLGLLLGSVGLGVIVLRNVLERRGELALLLAVGFRTGEVQKLVCTEHAALLSLGLALGIGAAVVAVLPAVLSPGSQLPFGSLTLTLCGVLANGALWTWLATRFALRGNLLESLRNE